MDSGRRKYAALRSILEVPILVDRFWAKVPSVSADAIMIDLEDSTQPADKQRARVRVLAAVGSPEYFGGRHVIVRVNNIATQWGRDDLAALASSPGEFLVCYPKVESADELGEVRELLSGAVGDRGLYVMIETARAMIELDRIASVPGVVGLHFGYVDYAASVGCRAFDDGGAGLYPPTNDYARAKIAASAAAYGLFCTGGSLIPDYKDLAKVRSFVKQWADNGYTACVAVSPAHLDIVNETMAPCEDEVKAAKVVCAAYEAAMMRGDPAAVVDGKVITMPDYRLATVTLARGLASERRD